MMLTTGEAAVALGVTPVTVWKWIKDGKLRAVQEPDGRRRWLISEGEVEKRTAHLVLPRKGRPPRGLDDVAYRVRCKKKLDALAEYHGMPRVEVVEALVEREWQKTLGGEHGSK